MSLLDQLLDQRGTYVLAGTQITFSIPPAEGYAGESHSGSNSGGTLTITADGNTFQYKKQ